MGEKIYKCDQCYKRFKFQTELRKHSYEHYKEQQNQHAQSNMWIPTESLCSVQFDSLGEWYKIQFVKTELN